MTPSRYHVERVMRLVQDRQMTAAEAAERIVLSGGERLLESSFGSFTDWLAKAYPWRKTSELSEAEEWSLHAVFRACSKVGMTIGELAIRRTTCT